MNKQKNISFDYTDNNKTCYKTSHWRGCCCECVNHGLVHKHCFHSQRKKKEGCVCDKSLNFYVCTTFGPRFNLSGKHGYCEMFQRRKK